MKNKSKYIELECCGSRTSGPQWGPGWLHSTPSYAPETLENKGRNDEIEVTETMISDGPIADHTADQPAGFICDRCGSTAYRDSEIHGGKSIRRDCAACNRTVGSPTWCPVSEQTRAERAKRICEAIPNTKPGSELLFDFDRATAIARNPVPDG